MPPTKAYTAADLLKDEMGIAPAANVVYNPFCLNALANRLYSEAYGSYVDNMRSVRDTIAKADNGKALLIQEGGSGGAKEEADLDGQWDANKGILAAFGGGCSDVGADALETHASEVGTTSTTHANRLLPPALQQLGGIVLRPQGDTRRGYAVPTVVLHYATGMAQIAEMYGEDMGDFEASGSEEWVCRPSEWGVGTSGVGPTLRELMKRVSMASKATADGAAMPILAIDTNTTSTETLELIATYCAALAAEHVDLDRQGILSTNTLPVYPTVPATEESAKEGNNDDAAAEPIDADEFDRVDIVRPRRRTETVVQPREHLYDLINCDPKLTLPISSSLPQPFNYLASAALLPPSTHSDMPVIMSKILRQAGDKFRVVSRLTSLIQHRWSDLPRFCVVPTVPNPKETQAAQTLQRATNSVATSMLCTEKRFKAPLKPLEAVFALEHLMPPLHGKHSPSSVKPPNEWSLADIVNQEDFRTLYQAMRKLPVLHSAARDTLAAFGTFQLDGNYPCGKESERVCGGYQVEPRLGFIPYMKAFPLTTSLGYVGPPSFIPPYLRCTLDQFIDNAEAKAQRMVSMMDEDVWKQDSKPLDLGIVNFKMNASTSSRVGVDETMGFYFVYDATKEDLEAMNEFRQQCGLIRKEASNVANALATNTTTPATGGTLQVPLHSPEDDICNTENKVTAQPLDYNEEEEAALIRASLTRTTDVMKVANFLGMAPLVELCGLVIAILLRGKSLTEVRDMFTAISSK